jgi:hypothetical protein
MGCSHCWEAFSAFDKVVRTVCDAVAKILFRLLLDMKKNLVATEDTEICAGIPSPSRRYNDTMHLAGQVFVKTTTILLGGSVLTNDTVGVNNTVGWDYMGVAGCARIATLRLASSRQKRGGH